MSPRRSGSTENTDRRPATDARDAAIRAIARQVGRFPDLGIVDPDTRGLPPRDAALARAIYDCVLRRWLTLEVLLQPRLKRPIETIEPRVRAALMAGAAQVLFFDRVPAHAAIHETVEWAKRRVRPGAGGMVNAVLRRISELPAGIEDSPAGGSAWSSLEAPGAIERDRLALSDGRALILKGEELPDAPGPRAAAATSHPAWLLERWAAVHGWAVTLRIAMHGLIVPPVILNTEHCKRPEGLAGCRPHSIDGHAVFEGDHEALGALLATEKDVWVQDPASAEAMRRVGSLSPSVVIDACAGNGTKTNQLSRVFPEAEVVACDPDRRRSETLRRAFEGHPRVRVIDFGSLYESEVGRADLVLLDVPCSNTGVLARRLEARYRVGGKLLKRLADEQRQIIADSIRLLGPGGSILYSTCSLEPEENWANAAWAAEWHRLTPGEPSAILPGGVPGQDTAQYTDGSWSVLLSGRGG